MFLFRAFVDHLLEELYEKESEPILALEEPETHLHPQAARTLWKDIQALPGQKIITTHSPHFAQHVPFRELRLVRLTKNGTKVRSLPTNFSASLPGEHNGLNAIVDDSNGQLTYEKASATLTVNGKLSKEIHRRLLRYCSTHGKRAALERIIKKLHDRSALYMSDGDLHSLEGWARRIRGEIFFAYHWLLVEGQTDYLIIHAIAHALGYDLDRHGVSVIDVQNNGNPAVFASLARALGIPWVAVFDGDAAGDRFVKKIADRDFSDEQVKERCKKLPEANDLEAQLVKDDLGQELRSILLSLGVPNAQSLSESQLLKHLRNKKAAYAAELAERIRHNPSLAQRSPKAFRDAIKTLLEIV